MQPARQDRAATITTRNETPHTNNKNPLPLALSAGGSYAVGALSIGIAYSNTQYGNDTYSTFHQTAKFNSGSAFLNYQITPALRAGVGYNYTSLRGPRRRTTTR